MKLYQVRDWDKHFENNKSRERQQLAWVKVPNKQGGMGLAFILSHENGLAIYGIWQLLIGALSHQCLPRAGWLTHDGHQTGTPWALGSLAVRWRTSESMIQTAFNVLSSQDVGWLIDHGEVPAECPEGARRVPAECPPPAQQVSPSGREEKRREEKEYTPDASTGGVDTSSPEKAGEKKEISREQVKSGVPPDNPPKSMKADFMRPYAEIWHVYCGNVFPWSRAAPALAKLGKELPVPKNILRAFDAFCYVTKNSKTSPNIWDFVQRLKHWETQAGQKELGVI